MSKKSNPTTQAIAKWQKARFGMFIHWGVYSATDLDCWKVYNMGIPIKDYIEKYEPGLSPFSNLQKLCYGNKIELCNCKEKQSSFYTYWK